MTKWMAILVLAGFALVTASGAGAQVRQDIATDRAQLQSDRQAIVAANLPLADDQAKAFWPLYRDYRAEMQKTGDRIVEIILDYAKNADAMTDAQATAMLDNYLAVQKDQLKIKSAWVPKFRKVLPSRSVTRLYQIENKIDAILQFDAAGEIPLVEDGQK